MSAWLIIPRDPLIFRDGKPFTGTPGERAKSMGFPYPSTIAGAVRTRSGTKPGSEFDKGRINELLGKTVRGPFLVELNHDGSIKTKFLPAPADALFVQPDGSGDISLYALSPIKLPADGKTDLSIEHPELNLVGYPTRIENKPFKDAPRFWVWEKMEAWLKNAVDEKPIKSDYGIQDLEREHRVHVSIRKDSQTSEEGALFQTSGLEFTRAELKDKRLHDAHTLAIALETDADLTAGADSLGGERRVVNWRHTKTFLPECPVVEEIKKHKHCRLILATSAHFKNGYLPEFLESQYKAKVEAVALLRYQTISGWDYAAKDKNGKEIMGGAPKPTRRLVPAGSVYFLNLKNVDIDKFIEEVWLNAVSDEEQSRRDGFGIALLGVWDGAVKTMEVK